MNDQVSPKTKSSSNLTNKSQKRNSSLGSHHCANCGEHVLSRKRTFSVQAWSALLLWNEITPSAIDQPICDLCYDEMS